MRIAKGDAAKRNNLCHCLQNPFSELKTLFESMKPHYDQFRLLVEEMHEKAMSARRGPDKAPFLALTAFFFIKEWKTFQSIYLLSENKFAEDAAVLTRTLFEATVNLLYIEKNTFKNVNLYQNYSYVMRYEKYKEAKGAIAALLTEPSNAESMAQLEENYKRVKDAYPNKFSWSGKSLKKMAKEVKLSDEYEVAYWLFSNLTHTNPQSIVEYVEQTPDGPVIGQESSPQSIERIWLFACSSFLFILDVVNKVFELGFDVRIHEINKSLQKSVNAMHP